MTDWDAIEKDPRWQPMDTAPRTATEVILKVKPLHYRGGWPTFYRQIAHWADSDGEGLQPGFTGWFQANGCGGFHQVSGELLAWMPIPATASGQQTG